MAQPSLPSFDYRAPENFIVRIGTGTGTNGVLGQVKSVSGRTTANRTKRVYRRVGSSIAVSKFGTPDYQSTCDLTLYSQNAAIEYMSATGDASPAELDVENEVTIRVEVYDDGGAISHSWQLDGAAPVESGFDVDSEATEGTTPLRFESANKWVLTTGA